MIGVEREDAAGLATLGKHHNSAEICREAFAILRRHHPQVYTIGTMIFGLPTDTRADLRRLAERQYELGMDYCFLIPLTPNPGTAVAEDLARRGLVANDDLASYNFHTPVCRTETLSLGELEGLYWRCMLGTGRRRLLRAARLLLTERDRRKRSVHRALFRRGTVIAARCLADAVLGRKNRTPTLHSRKPPWYDQ
jgi:hypothetical protein